MKHSEDGTLIKELLNLKRNKIGLARLYLDPNNPRFGIDRYLSDNRVVEDAVQQNAQKKIEEIGIEDLKLSVQRYGFAPTDPIVVRPLTNIQNKFVVLEGNRRVATLK